MKICTNSLMSAVLLVMICSITACTSSDVKTELHSGIILKNMDTTVSPGDDFMAYVNGTWIKNTVIPSDKSGYGAAYMLEDKAEEEVKAIIENAAKAGGKEGSEEQKIGDFYNAYLNVSLRDSLGLAPLQEDFKKIDAIASLKDLAAYFAYANTVSYMVPLEMAVIEDFKDPTKYMVLTWQGGLGLPEREYYSLKDARSADLRVKYLKHVETMLGLAGLPDAKGSAEKIMALESRLAASHMKKEDTRDIAGLYNKYAVKDLGKLGNDIDWNTVLSGTGIKNIDSIVIAQVAYTRDLNAILKSTPLDTWKTYLKWSAVNSNATYLNTALDVEHFNFFGKTLNGVKEQKPQWQRAVKLVNTNLGMMVGKLYVEKHFSPEAKKRMLVLVDNLLKAYEESIKTLDWMGIETKKEALDKVSKFTAKIGYPDKWRDYTALKVVKNDLSGNQRRATQFLYKRMIDKLGKPVDRTEWSMTPQTVNAYYNPLMNEIVFPAAYLQPPFFDMNAEDAVNYGGVGATIGHEIGHGFDDKGSAFDGNGVMRNWWAEKDLTEFKKRTATLVAQYNAFKVFPDLNVNGEFTQGENIGDLGGLTIALQAYKVSLKGKPAPVMDGFTGEQRVFIGYGQSWQEKSTEELLRRLVTTDPHAPPAFRVNGVVRNIPEFYTAFNVKPGDSLYLAPEKRVKIW